ncbi:MAG: phage tail tape measure protein [Promicromonosporaceae bacterium]|nr:phage tail tape measure protein [Promicromonosporaceae bacterium]
MADRSVRLVLSVVTQGLVTGLRNAQQATTNFTSNLERGISNNSATINGLSAGLALVGTAAVSAVGLAVKRFADFDKAMSSVQAATGETSANMDKLRQAALDAGAKTVYSATEAAAGIEELGKAGLSTSDILGGALTGALNLAASDGMAVADAAELTATALTQFGLSGEKASHIADLLAAGAGKAQGSAGDLGQALNQSGLIAHQFGLSVDDTVGALALFAKNGLIGSDAGTSFKTMLVALANPSKQAQGAMDDLGISAYDAGGKFVGVAALADQLQTKLGGLTEQQRQQTLATIFGTDALRAASVLYSEGAQGVADMTNAVNANGFAAQQAATRLDNLAGDWENFTGALDTALIGAGEGANGPLRNLVEKATDVVNAFSGLPAPIQQASALLVGGGGLALLGIAGMGKLATSVVEVIGQVRSLGNASKVAKIAVGGIGSALAVGTLALTAWADNVAEAKGRVDSLKGTLDDLGNTTDDTVRTLNDTLSQGNQVNLWEKIFGAPKENDTRSAFELADQLKIKHEDITRAILGEADAQDRVNKALAGAQDNRSVWDTNTLDAASTLSKIIDEQSAALAKSTTEAQRKAAADEAAGVAQTDLVAAAKATNDAIEEQNQALQDNWEAQMKASQGALSARDAQRQYQQATDDAKKTLEESAGVTDKMYDKQGNLTKRGQELVAAYVQTGKALDITTEAGRKNQAALDDIASTGLDVVDSMRQNGASQEDLQKSMATTRQAYIDAATSMGMSKEAAEKLADQLGLIPTNTTANVEVKDNVDTEVTRITKALQSIPKSTTTTVYANTSAAYGAISQLNAALRAAGSGQHVAVGGGGSGGLTFADGGYTGPGGKYQPAGVVHRGEYVFTAEATNRIGVGALNQLNYGQFPGYAGGGLVGGPAGTGPASVSRSLTVVNQGPRLDPVTLRHYDHMAELLEVP